MDCPDVLQGRDQSFWLLRTYTSGPNVTRSLLPGFLVSATTETMSGQFIGAVYLALCCVEAFRSCRWGDSLDITTFMLRVQQWGYMRFRFPCILQTWWHIWLWDTIDVEALKHLEDLLVWSCLCVRVNLLLCGLVQLGAKKVALRCGDTWTDCPVFSTSFTSFICSLVISSFLHSFASQILAKLPRLLTLQHFLWLFWSCAGTSGVIFSTWQHLHPPWKSWIPVVVDVWNRQREQTYLCVRTSLSITGFLVARCHHLFTARSILRHCCPSSREMCWGTSVPKVHAQVFKKRLHRGGEAYVYAVPRSATSSSTTTRPNKKPGGPFFFWFFWDGFWVKWRSGAAAAVFHTCRRF